MLLVGLFAGITSEKEVLMGCTLALDHKSIFKIVTYKER
jgi:hypothetical protein